MQTQTRTRSTIFEHDDTFRGDVVIVRGGQRLTVPIEELQHLVGEKLRAEALLELQSMRPGEFLARRGPRPPGAVVRSLA